MSVQHAVNFLVNAINTGDYYSIKNAEKNIPYGYSLNSVLAAMDSSSRKKYEKILNRDSRFRDEIEKLEGTLRTQAVNQEKAIQNIRTNFESAIKAQTSRYDNEINALNRTINGELKKHETKINNLETVQQAQRQEYIKIANELNQAIAGERNERIQAVNNLQKQVSRLQDNEAEQKRLAKEMLKGVDLLVDEIGKMPHERFASGKLQTIKNSVNAVRNAVSSVMAAGAWANLTTAWNDLWDLKAEISVKEFEFITKFDQAFRSSANLLNEAAKNKNRELEFPSADNSNQTKNIEVDFWSNGDLAKYEKKIVAIQKELEANENNSNFGIEDVDKILQRIAKEGPELGNIIIKAANNVAASEIRFDMAEIGANVLMEQLFDEESIKATYEGGDKRAGYVLQMENENGSKATIVVAPSEEKEEQGKFKMTINFENDEGNISAGEIKNRSEKIEQLILSEVGILGAEKQGQSSCSNSPNRDFSDIEKVKNRKKEEFKTVSIN